MRAEELRKTIYSLDATELTNLIDIVRSAQKLLSAKNRFNFHGGQHVSWRSAAGLTKTGYVQKIMTKNAQVLDKNGSLWRVPLSMLSVAQSETLRLSK